MVSARMTPTPVQLAEELAELGADVADLRPIKKDIEQITLDAIKRAHASRGASIGAPWGPYKPSYAKRAKRTQPSLYESGALYNAATTGAKKSLRRTKTWQKLTYRVRSVYVGVQEFGWPKKNIKARHFIFLNEGSVRNVMGVVDKHVSIQIEKFYRKRPKAVPKAGA